MASEAKDHELDELLDSTLEEFQKVDLRRPAARDALCTAQPSSSCGIASGDAGGSQKNPEAEPAPTIGQGLGMTLLERKKPGVKKNKGTRGGTSENTGAGGSRPTAAGENVAATIERLAQQTRHAVENISPDRSGEVEDDETLEQLAQQFEQLGGTQDMQALMDTVMRQLLSKDVLHAPMQEISERYPDWLAQHKATLSEEDYNRYCRQHEYMKQLCNTYETAPEDFGRIVDLLQQMQNCGQPPKDIIRELAPGVEFGEDGMPTMLPDLLLGQQGELTEQCAIM